MALKEENPGEEDSASRDPLVGGCHRVSGRTRRRNYEEQEDAGPEGVDDEEYQEYVPVKKRKQLEAQKFLQRNRRGLASSTTAFVISTTDENGDGQSVSEAKPSLLAKASHLKRELSEISVVEQIGNQEKLMMECLSECKMPLVPVRERAKGIQYTEPMETGWKPPSHVRHMSEKECEEIRKRWHILVEGEAVPPPCQNFTDMRFPDAILQKLNGKGIMRPTPIQVQGLPVIQSGRDMIGIAFTGSGKTLVFTLPLIMLALQEELRMPIHGGEGPFGLVVCPSRELARQTFDVVEEFVSVLKSKGGYPDLKSMLCIGGVDKRPQVEAVKRGVHVVIATPGRLKTCCWRKR
ncbi:hypothetical protein GOP47_0008978 [Adiantum capillus-veneris]|uniref:RNA helicase n=1 Tax=Adiantum capillus-veneris TaxID=13818 RepID=A0A9D4ZIJ0_ADICA|nr:hypothetical protein GOP47_0008978 [Adiantum capillus-veneris]